MTTETYQGNPRLRSVRIDVDGKSCQFMTDSQRVTMIPLKIRRKQNRKLLTPPSGTMSNVMSGGVDIPMIKTLGKDADAKFLVAITERIENFPFPGGVDAIYREPKLKYIADQVRSFVGDAGNFFGVGEKI